MPLLLYYQILLFSIFPLYFTILSKPVRRVHFYVYISLILLIGGFLGNVYSIPITHDIAVSGGNLCYGAFMMTSVMLVWIEKDLIVLRHIVRLVVSVNVFNILFSNITQSMLQSANVLNPHNAPSNIFEISTPMIAIGGALIITELLILLVIFEFVRKKTPSPFITGSVYILSFIAVLVFDGVAFPFVAFGFNAQIVAIVIGGLGGKLFIAVVFSLPLLVFILWQRTAFNEYLTSESFHWRLLTLGNAGLIREIARKDQDVRLGDIIFRNSTEGLAIINKSGSIVKANNAFETMLNISTQDGFQKTPNVNNLFRRENKNLRLPHSSQGASRREVVFGEAANRYGILSITPTGESIGDAKYVYSLIDITEQKKAQDRFEYLASHDQLTGLPNRRALDQRLADFGERAYVLMIIDLDFFKDINDSYGHHIGDRVLKIVATRLDELRQKHLNSGDTLYRMGGDEFAILISSTDKSFVERFLENIQPALAETVSIENVLEVFLSATVGVSYQLGHKTQDPLIEADAALYEAKRSGRGSVRTYEEWMIADSQRTVRLGLRLKNAIKNNLLDVCYQPQFDAVTQEIRGIEALARWNDAELGPIPPSDFIPVAERSGLIELLGDYVLEIACRDGHEWQKLGFPPVTLSVNVSATQLRFGRFRSSLLKTLAVTGFPPNRLEIEITESTYIERQNEILPFLKELKEMGIGIAIDDFGTGYSSLSYLREMPWSCIKIDRSFVKDIPYNSKQCSLTSAIIKLAKVMSLKVVAEGVETREQLNFLREEGCDLIQGYYLGRVLSKDELWSFISRQT